MRTVCFSGTLLLFGLLAAGCGGGESAPGQPSGEKPGDGGSGVSKNPGADADDPVVPAPAAVDAGPGGIACIAAPCPGGEPHDDGGTAEGPDAGPQCPPGRAEGARFCAGYEVFECVAGGGIRRIQDCALTLAFCRDGACASVPYTGRCTAHADCGDDFCLPHDAVTNVCSAPCQADSDCAEGICVPHGPYAHIEGNVCRAPCTDDFGCPPDFHCAEEGDGRRACEPRCELSIQCDFKAGEICDAEAAACIAQEGVGGDCATGNDCPQGMRCVTDSRFQRPFCSIPCLHPSKADDCQAQFPNGCCAYLEGEPRPICVPANYCALGCCSESDPCGLAGNKQCECPGAWWEEPDCRVASEGGCCDPSNPCGMAVNFRCECPDMPWDTYDCKTNACCGPTDGCAFKGDGFCDCGGDYVWDYADCGQPIDAAQCCQEADPCGFGGDGFCDCKGLPWDLTDCGVPGGDPAFDCCAAGNPCTWDYDGVCDCGGAFAWDDLDCKSTPEACHELPVESRYCVALDQCVKACPQANGAPDVICQNQCLEAADPACQRCLDILATCLNRNQCVSFQGAVNAQCVVDHCACPFAACFPE